MKRSVLSATLNDSESLSEHFKVLSLRRNQALKECSKGYSAQVGISNFVGLEEERRLDH